jgi:LmbE family N-acetylglucosaminyl deacetylase
VSVRVDLPVPRRALAVGAHPDDIEFGCGATLAKWSDAGTEVHLCICTDGSKGTWDAGADITSLVSTREEEQRDAAKVLGAFAVRFLHRIDGELINDRATRAELCAAIREVRPDVMLGHDPWRPYRLHPDHREAGFLVVEAIVAARDPHFFPEQALEPHRPDTLLLFEPARVDHLERVDHHVDRKVDALLAHRSQWRSTMAIDETDAGRQRAAFVDRIHDDAGTKGLRAGLRAAEVFARIDKL